MSRTVNAPSAGIIRDFYFDATLEGWAGGAPKTTSFEFPGLKVINIPMGAIAYKDMYWTCPGSNRSFGVTIMSTHDFERATWVPVWHMQYGGEYPERVIDFLKLALLETAKAKKFFGGRGPLKFQQGNLQYRNKPERNSFRDFKGEEWILEDGVQVGFHWYRGSLIVRRT